MININSYKTSPFGLLSLDAQTPFNLDNQTWSSVAEYVYVNVFDNKETRQKMSENLRSKKRYQIMLMLKEGDDLKLLEKNMLDGLVLRFNQNPNLKRRLMDTRGSELVFPERQIENEYNAHGFMKNILLTLNNIRDKDVLDTMTGNTVQKEQVERVVEGVAKAILNNEEIDPNSTYQDLLKYQVPYPAKPLPLNDAIFLNINRMLSIINFRLRKELRAKELLRFKKHLMDVYLDFILDTEYPNVLRQDYSGVKTYELSISNPTFVTLLENQLYSLYSQKSIDYLITRRLLFEPLVDVAEQIAEENELEKSLLLSSDTNVGKFYIYEDDPFLPQYLEQFQTEGRVFNSVTHYAFYKLFESIGSNRDVGLLSYEEMFRLYIEDRNNYLVNRIKKNNEKANTAKFTQNPVLYHLLNKTSTYELVNTDDNDAILGTAKDNFSPDNNLLGRYLSFLRDQTPKLPGLVFSSDFPTNILVNGVLSDFIKQTKKIRSLILPDVADIAYIFNITPGFQELSRKEQSYLKRKGLDKDDIKLLGPLLKGLSISLGTSAEKALSFFQSRTSVERAERLYEALKNSIVVSRSDFIEAVVDTMFEK